MDLERVAAALAPTDVVGRAPITLTDLAYDAQRATPGSLFFCVPGARADGHDHAIEAVRGGAVALVVERPLPVAVPQLVVADAREAMAVAADVFFGMPTAELRVAGITGTNGKTTTALILWTILERAGLRPGLIGTLESRVGGRVRAAGRTTPEAIDLQRTFREMLGAGDRSCVIEASSHASELHRLDRVRFAALVFTNLTQDHLDFHGTIERYYAAKRRLFEGRPAPPAAVNVADDHGRRLAEELRAGGHPRLLTFGWEADADVRPEGLSVSAEGARFRAAGLELCTRLRGRFNLENVLAAVAAARLLELPDAAIVAGVEGVRGVPGRFETVDEGQRFTVVIDYAHTPDSLENVLRTARELTERQLVCVFGCGGERDREKRPLMGRVARELSDRVIVTSDNPRGEGPLEIIGEIVRGAGEDVEVEPDRRSAIESALESAEPGDVIVVAGKGHEQGQEAAGKTVPFDDRAVAREMLRRLRART